MARTNRSPTIMTLAVVLLVSIPLFFLAISRTGQMDETCKEQSPENERPFSPVLPPSFVRLNLDSYMNAAGAFVLSSPMPEMQLIASHASAVSDVPTTCHAIQGQMYCAYAGKDSVSKAFFDNFNWERQHWKWVVSTLKLFLGGRQDARATYLDLGAFVSDWLVPICREDARIDVVAVEAYPSTALLSLHNLISVSSAYPRAPGADIAFYPEAVVIDTSRHECYTTLFENNLGGSALGFEDIPLCPEHLRPGRTSLAYILQETARTPLVLKMDIQDAEVAAVLSAVTELQKFTPCYVIMEVYMTEFGIALLKMLEVIGEYDSLWQLPGYRSKATEVKLLASGANVVHQWLMQHTNEGIASSFNDVYYDLIMGYSAGSEKQKQCVERAVWFQADARG
eukprot:TRINITY_DN9184_c0_g1_i1.p1 TRINITY_DN9184_c0_g1~~TRINITY_DN9184_c0_g1_i1.p1  ORF type:complete len:396 (-),score=39.64 TRINITY_DN9184_c0_g1_i1:29-1216(-)